MRQHSNTALTEAYCNLRRTIDCFEHCVALVDTAVPGWRLVYTNLTWNKTAGGCANTHGRASLAMERRVIAPAAND